MDNGRKQEIVDILRDGYYPDQESAEEATKKIVSVIEQEKTIYHILRPKFPNHHTLNYELDFYEIAKGIDEAEREGYKPAKIVLQLQPELGNIYGLPVRLKLLE